MERIGTLIRKISNSRLLGCSIQMISTISTTNNFYDDIVVVIKCNRKYCRRRRRRKKKKQWLTFLNVAKMKIRMLICKN